MRLTTKRMYDRMLASDASYNGQFFAGVLTTGIYCLPACKARKPKPENVKFFPTCEAARAAGLRPCKKCHPDDFARGADPVLETVEALADEIRARPQAFADVTAVVRRSGFGATRLFELLRLHYHVTPAELLTRARVARARELLVTSDEGLLQIAHAAGFESSSVFHEQFRRATGLTPAAYRSLRGSRRFAVALGPGYPLGYLRRALTRDAQSLSERMEGDHYVAAVRLTAGPALLSLDLYPDHVDAEISNGSGVEAHAIVTGLLGLEQDAPAFARLAKKLGLARLVHGREGLRVSQTPSVFDGLVWSIIGQQINFAFACQLRRRLVELAGEEVTAGLRAMPTPEAVAALKVSDLKPLQFSDRKAEYLIQTAHRVVRRELDVAKLPMLSATRAERTLLSIRGLGPWSVNYLMMRSLGFSDCVPLGDTGVTSGLQALLQLEERPDIDATRRLMQPFSPYRSLATAHLWQFGKPIP
jgi:AraC family transcriptional regulator of adaptative response / DNA-3-methyladenine glycosylase II